MADIKKIKLGQFFTCKDYWLISQVKAFIKDSNCPVAYDPFAGAANLLSISDQYGINKIYGLDIDKKLKWTINDSLLNIPTIDNAIIITNPSYIAKNSATRKNLDLIKYFQNSEYDDIYFIALDQMLKAQKYV